MDLLDLFKGKIRYKLSEEVRDVILNKSWNQQLNTHMGRTTWFSAVVGCIVMMGAAETTRIQISASGNVTHTHNGHANTNKPDASEHFNLLHMQDVCE